MIKTEKGVTYFLIDWKHHINQAKKLGETLESITLKLTVTYQETKSFTGNTSSAVERYVMQREKIENELSRLLDSIQLCIAAINHCGLTTSEKEVIKCLMDRKKLIAYAEENGIYWSYVYKIKERAIKKIVKYINKNSECEKKAVKN